MSREVIPQKDFIIMELQQVTSTRLVLPETMDKMRDPTHEFRVIKVGPGFLK